MSVKKCPECKSANTRQTHKPEFAYCLSCYHVFKNVIKVDINQVKLRIRNQDVLKNKIATLEQQLIYYKEKLKEVSAKG